MQRAHRLYQPQLITARSRPVSTERKIVQDTAVRAVPTSELDLVGLGLRAPHKETDGVLRGLRRHS